MTYFRRTFAQSGDKLAVPIDDPADGSVSYQTGYGAQYSQDPTTTATARRIERTKYNQILSDITTEVQRYQQNAYPEFITSSDNGGSPFSYSKGATVRYSGSVYRSLIDSNTTLPTDISSWYNIDSLRPTVIAKSADYTITDTDNIKSIPATSGASVVTIELPVLANNLNREISLFKADTGTGTVVLAAQGADTIQGSASKTLYTQYDRVKVIGTSAGWLVLDLLQSGKESDIGTITNWASPGSKRYRWTRTGNKVDFWWYVTGTGGSNSSSATFVLFDLPADVPSPANHISNDASGEFPVPCSGAMNSSNFSKNYIDNSGGTYRAAGAFDVATVANYWSGHATWMVDP